ncbi:hypothetical protein H6A68_02760 [Bifidobacterium pullorum subsp. saeculare]|uniref:hypothetical protein n=1 Tax=Bifidobacterium pullorum TaxID=78448 RepID=UPI00195B335A|nr:hypothetical protein [Bifidobacterium pullorum]MBM6705984.1 hypothetical protein [Bifidobacterium pullorum subsp. saeculare]
MSIYDIIMSTPALADAVHAAQSGTLQPAHPCRRPLTDGELRARNRRYSRTYYWRTHRPAAENFYAPLID